MKIRLTIEVCLISIAVSVVLYSLGSNQVRKGEKYTEFSSDLFKDFCNNENNNSRYTTDHTHS
jgi:hypothetical protein